jgi:hypothetical protein
VSLELHAASRMARPVLARGAPGTADLKFHAAYFCPAPKASTGSVASPKAAAITA